MTMRAHTILLLLAVAGCAGARGPRGDVAAARRDLSRALLERGDLGGAYAVLQPLLAAQPRDAEALALRGTVLREQGLLQEAEADLKEALRLESKLAFAHASIGILYDLQGKAQDAESHHRAAVEREPRNARYLNNLAFSLFAHGEAREAIPLYLEAVRYDPRNPRVQNNLAFAFAVTGDWPRAKRHFDAGGNPSDARLNLGYAYEKADQPAQAHALYAEAVRLDPGSTHARESLARVAEALGKPPPEAAAQPGASAPREGGP